MKKAIGLLLVLLWCGAGTAHALTADELIAKNIAAKGGMKKMKAIRSLRTAGTMLFAGHGFSVELNFTSMTKRHGKLRTEASLQGMTAITAYDGKVGWQVQPFFGRRDPEKMSADNVKGLEVGADMDGSWIDYKAKGHKVRYLGTEDMDGTDAHKLEVKLKNGDTRIVYFDPDYFLEIRIVDQMMVRGVKVIQETDLGNYELIDGVYVPFSIEIGPKNAPKTQKIEITKAEANVKLDDALFTFPAGRAKTAN